MEGYHYQNADSLPSYFDDIVDGSEKPPYSYQIDLKIRLASEYGYSVFSILADALAYMNYKSVGTSPESRRNGVILAAEYIKNLIAQKKVKAKIFFMHYNDATMPQYTKYYLNPSDGEDFIKDVITEWDSIQLRKNEKEKGNIQKNINFPFLNPEDDPGREEFWFYNYNGVSVAHPDDPFWDEVNK